MRIRTRWVLVGALAIGCGSNVSTSDDGDDDGAPGAEADGGQEGGVDLPPDVGVPNPCGDGEGLCEVDGEELCVDLTADNDNCGRCGNKCYNAANLGGCVQGICPPNYECGGDRTDYRNCSEMCEAIGTECVDGVGCNGNYLLYYDITGVDACEDGLSGTTISDGLCSDPIDWENRGGLNLTPPVAVSCCCLQDFKSEGESE